MYQITLTGRQLATLSVACELLARLHFGQFDKISDLFWHDFDQHKASLLERELEAVIRPPRKSPNDATDIPWDLYQVFRHRLAWDRLEGDKPPTHSVLYDTPLKRSTQPLAKVEKCS